MNIGIIGLGLIGGSLGLDLYSHRQQTQTQIHKSDSATSPPPSYRILGISLKQKPARLLLNAGLWMKLVWIYL